MLASFVGIYLSKHREREGEAPRALPVEGATQAPVIEGKPIAKRGKMSGAKRVIRCLNCFKDKIVPLNQDIDSRCEYGGLFVDLLNPWYEDGVFIL
jgi:nicotinic acid phosphoribosyltransferase